MNVLLLSPGYPPNMALFGAALASRGATVLGIGDLRPDALAYDARSPLTDYVHVPNMEDYDSVVRAVGLLIHRHGRLDHLDSLNEHWLPLEAKLREDFNAPGFRPYELQRGRSKSQMAEVFEAAGVPVPACGFVRSPAVARAFAKEHGFPLMLKLDVGCGAERAFSVDDEPALEAAIHAGLSGYVIQTFVTANMTSFDGLVDRDGRLVFAGSFRYGDGVLETIRDNKDVWLYTRREIPHGLVSLGESALAAFDVRASFFHFEAFELDDGSFQALEINLRPPGGFLLDVMNYSADVDLYGLWADVVTYAPRRNLRYERRYHAAHVGRRNRSYKADLEEVRRTLGPSLLATPAPPTAIGASMGDPIFLIRHADEAELRRLIDFILA